MADTGFGVTITFGSGFFASIRNVDPPGMSREPIDTSHATTTNGDMTFMPSDLQDNGEMEVEFLFDPDSEPPIDQAAESVTITWPLPSGQATPATWVFSGFLTNWSGAAPYDDLMTATGTIKVSGAITFTASA